MVSNLSLALLSPEIASLFLKCPFEKAPQPTIERKRTNRFKRKHNKGPVCRETPKNNRKLNTKTVARVSFTNCAGPL